MQLKGFVTIKGRIELLSGLHIGAGRETMEIGGLDQPIIKHPFTGEPYIPGSSLKGRMRALLEQVVFMSEEGSGAREWITVGKPCGCAEPTCYVCKIFGASHAKNREEKKIGPTRLLVRDCRMAEKWLRRFYAGELGMEEKFENHINRVTGTAKDPRTLERVPAGVEFAMELVLRVYEGDDAKKMVEYVAKGLKLIELDALGGNGSRGCGQVKFPNKLTVEKKGDVKGEIEEEIELGKVAIP